jgi:hypothetical protein
LLCCRRRPSYGAIKPATDQTDQGGDGLLRIGAVGHDIERRAAAKKKSKPKSPFIGRWHIVSMSTWGEDYLNEEVQAFIEFDDKGGGSFQFGYVQGVIDYREGMRDGQPAAEFSWEGGDGTDGTPLTGRGWATVQGDRLRGMIFIHLGDDSDFEALRVEGKK